MHSTATPILNLPKEVLDLILIYLDARSFLVLCSTCRALHHADIRLNATYWRRAVRSFRVPNQPAVEGDGERWQKLYRRLVTQTHTYTWGNNANGSLGHSFELDSNNPGTGVRRPRGIKAFNVSIPREMDDASKLGVLADLQCGGWSTTVLTSQGILCSVGSLQQSVTSQPAFRDLRFPPGYPNPRERYDPATAIQQFSAGRAHVLGLSDSGRIWFWNHVDWTGSQIKFLGIDILEGEIYQRPGIGRVKKIVAGWTKSSALIEGTGIVIWDAHEPNLRARGSGEQEEDTWLVLKADIVPGTSYERPRKPSSGGASTQARDPINPEDFGEVVDYIMMEEYTVFLTHAGRVFASKGSWTPDSREMSFPVEIPVPDNIIVTALHGNFRSFALILANDDVLIATPDLGYLSALIDAYKSPHLVGDPHRPSVPSLKRYPCLQKRGVVTLAFGDWHWHALLRDGSILSGGTESQSCGSFGLGGEGDPEGRIRGLRYRAVPGHAGQFASFHQDGVFVKQCYAGLGRQVWFEEEKRALVRFVTSGGSDPAEAAERMQMCAVESDAQAEVSEWLEQRGRNWEKRDCVKQYDDDGLGPYFALSIAAGGWHSGALVVRNDVLVDKIRESCIVPNPSLQSQVKESEAKTSTEEGEGLMERSDEQGASASISSLVDWGWQSVRWALGLLPSQDHDTTTMSPPAESSAPSRESINSFCDPVNHGASPGEGFKFIWADDPFPRLKLMSEQEMPGQIPFSSWVKGAPDWDLDFEA